MSNRLNFSNINDAWGIDTEESNAIRSDSVSRPQKFSYKKPKENIMSIDSNEIKIPIKKEFKPIQETYSDYIKPCSLVEEHIKNCDICKSKLGKNHNELGNNNIIKRLGNTSEHMTSNILNMSKEYLDTNFDLNEHFENVSPSQKNLLIIVLYGILIILISDLIIKEKDE